jgi:sortase A
VQHRPNTQPFASVALVCLVVGVLTVGVALISERFLLGNTETHASNVGAGPVLDASQVSENSPAVPSESNDSANVENRNTSVDPVMPARLAVPRLSVDAHVQHVGYTDDGKMDSPTEWEDVAWFQYGYLPGAPGNAVMAGHLDSTTGPAIFAGLYLMEPGDEIYVTGQNGDELTFVVTEVETVPAEDAPLDRVFGASDTPRLNLITCEGHFDPDEEDYDHRLIVYTELVSS